MTVALGTWTLALDGGDPPSRDLIGGKAWSVARMQALGLTVPPAFVVTTRACAAFMAAEAFPEGLEGELAAGIAWLESKTGRRFGEGPSPLLVSVRSGAPISMPGMMDTVLNLGMTDATETALGLECGNAKFARDTHRRFLDLYAHIVLKETGPHLAPDGDPAAWREEIRKIAGKAVPQNASDQLHAAVRAVFESWNSRRARRYRQHHAIPDGLGTAVTVQAMVFGNADDRSGTGVLFSRNPLNGEPVPYGEFLQRAQGEDVVSGKFTPKPLSAMSDVLPEAHDALLKAARVLEHEGRDVQDIEFTVERGHLYLLQSRAAKLAPQAAVRVAVDLAEQGVITVKAAVERVTADQVRILLSPHLTDQSVRHARELASGEGASPGVGIGTVVSSSDEAERRARAGEAVILARPTTSPDDLHGMIAAKAVVTEQGGSTSHAAVVGRALGLPCVVGCGAGSLAAMTGRTVTVDGRAGKIYDGALEIVAPDENANHLLVTLARWAAALSPLKVFAVERAPHADIVDLDAVPEAADPQRIGAVLAAHKGAKGVRGGIIASEEGIRAAIQSGFEFIVASPVLPALLTAVRIAAAHIPPAHEEEHA